MDIKITSPVSIFFDATEIDKHVPSIQFAVTIKVQEFNYSLDISSCIWVDCKCFDEFVDAMRNEKPAELVSMNGRFKLKLDPASNMLEWLCSKETLDGCITYAQGSKKTRSDLQRAIAKAFIEYPKWW